MDARIGWLLAAVLLGVGWQQYGWQGVVTAVTVIVFWLLLQFNRAMKVMRGAARSPVGHVPSAVMFNARLKRGMKMIEVVALARSLGEQVSPPAQSPEVWRWTDEGGSRVVLEFQRAALVRWTLERPSAEAEEDAGTAVLPPSATP
ncbi:hypothetical protein [Aquabacterium sp. J223]|uniref:hypothetical protein n=1 Tax=Aquabacterium sp. J223 TaxID=2898431 RepID=UPI0021AE0818|nr:hypothetical protein [Aquabacterium sp. J223]UUX96329.1 hypothetical protein LRS07_03125 [Aquabacterium sp. J223]